MSNFSACREPSGETTARSLRRQAGRKLVVLTPSSDRPPMYSTWKLVMSSRGQDASSPSEEFSK
ncbi:hypothetical protein RTBOTA2_000859 [Rhodotorula toruloides]|nr:hypothetical protein RTBOTA2_000859 [Rhodotorula toruloides]